MKRLITAAQMPHSPAIRSAASIFDSLLASLRGKGSWCGPWGQRWVREITIAGPLHMLLTVF